MRCQNRGANRGVIETKVMNFEYWCRCMHNFEYFSCSGGGQAAVYDGGRWFLLLVALGSSFLSHESGGAWWYRWRSYS